MWQCISSDEKDGVEPREVKLTCDCGNHYVWDEANPITAGCCSATASVAEINALLAGTKTINISTGAIE